MPDFLKLGNNDSLLNKDSMLIMQLPRDNLMLWTSNEAEAVEEVPAEVKGNDESYKDSMIILQLLRDNLMLWTSDKAEGEEGVTVDVKWE